MLKKRIAATLNIKSNTLVKGVKFKSHRTLNDVIAAVKIFCIRDIDELIILDVGKNIFREKPDFNFLKLVTTINNISQKNL